jgi:dTDP-4-amino-4,6-dideoxygalactose transaminase
VVIDAAASLGTIADDGRGFGTGFSGAVVYSMHVTKSFSTAEGGLIYSANTALMRTLRSMSNFGFGESRNATRMGLNGKISEVSALLANLRLENFETLMDRRSQLVDLYRQSLPQLTFQPRRLARQSHQFTSTLLPAQLAPCRKFIQAEIAKRGVDSANYFSPHVAEQDYFRPHADLAALPVTNNVASRALTLPLYDAMTNDEVSEVVTAVRSALDAARAHLRFEAQLSEQSALRSNAPAPTRYRPGTA